MELKILEKEVREGCVRIKTSTDKVDFSDASLGRLFVFAIDRNKYAVKSNLGYLIDYHLGDEWIRFDFPLDARDLNEKTIRLILL